MKKLSNKELNLLLKNNFNVKLNLNNSGFYEVYSEENIKTIIQRLLNLYYLIQEKDCSLLNNSDKWLAVSKYPQLQNNIDDYCKIESGTMTSLFRELITLENIHIVLKLKQNSNLLIMKV